ncbi:MAG: hypothetical protein ACRENE_15805 [Polyangiaceae bacterium]
MGTAVWALDEYGPRSRVLFLTYLPDIREIAHVLVASAVGLSLCADAAMRFSDDAVPYRPVRLAVGCSLGGLLGIVLGVIMAAVVHGRWGAPDGLATVVLLACTALAGFVGAFAAFKRWEAASSTSSRSLATRAIVAGAFLAWVIVRQLDALPSHGSVAERDAWARAHLREYPALALLVSQLPVVRTDLTKVVVVAPMGTGQHSYALDMDGDGMRFTLEVVGETSRGTLWIDATFSEGKLIVWRGGRWTFNGVTTPVEGPKDGL